MTLRLTEEETAALRAQAAREDRSMQEVARTAVRRYIELDDHRTCVTQAAAEGAARHAEIAKHLEPRV